MGAISPTYLQCEYAVDPIAVDTPEPRFSWVMKARDRGQVQSGYRILVAGSRDLLEAGVGDRWDSGRVSSDASVNVAYAGAPLGSSERCYWNVQAWDADGLASLPSAYATFAMGLLHAADWAGIWVQTPAEIAAPLLRKTFEIEEPVADARIHLSGLGLYELYINGVRVGDRVLDPALADYRRRVPYVTYDVAAHLRPGRNVVAIMLGDGWYRGLSGNRFAFSESLQLLVQMNVTCVGGNVLGVPSDTSWRVAPGPITQNSLQEGETCDARLEKTGWENTDYDDSDWDQVQQADPPPGALFSQQLPPMRVVETRAAVSRSTPAPGVSVFDFGQLFGGWVRLRLSGPAGGAVSIKHSSRILPQGVIDDAAYPGKKECDTYILRGDPSGEVYEPRFTFHPVRYVQVTGETSAPSLQDITGCVVHSDVDLSASFQCSDELLNRIHSNVTWSLRNALKGFPLDCLHREPLGYNEPASASSILYTRTFMPSFWTKWLADIRAAQSPDGALSDWAPELPGSNRQHDAAQAGNFAPLVWYLYHYYEDRRLLSQNYPAMRKWVDYLSTIAQDDIITTGWLGDHLLPGPAPGYEEYVAAETPPPLLWTGYYYLGARVVADAARVLGYADDARVYTALAARLREAYNAAFFDQASDDYAAGSQTANSFSLLIGVTPLGREGAVAANIRRAVMVTHGGHIHTGHVGTTSLIEALIQRADGETLLSLASRTTYPGWGYMVAQGATTIWESWGHDWAADHDPTVRRAAAHRADSMMMWGCIDKFFYHGLAGIGEPAFHGSRPFAPGFREAEIRPLVVGELTAARAQLRTVRGMLSSSWERRPDSFALQVVIPVNSTATVAIPKLKWDEVAVSEGGRVLVEAGTLQHESPGVLAAKETDRAVELRIGSGSYAFVLQPVSRSAHA